MVRLVVFLLTFLGIYAAMHAVVYFGLRPLFPSRFRMEVVVLPIMALMLFSPVLARVLDRSGQEIMARVFSFGGYIWMGFLFLAFVLFLFLFGWNFLAWGMGRVFPPLSGWTLYSPASSAIVLLIALAAGGYGIYEASRLRIEKVRIETEKWSVGNPPLRLVQISDLHLGMLHGESTIMKIAAALEKLELDLLVATGDIVDAQLDHMNEMGVALSRLNPPLGKYAVTGNHEFYAGLDQALRFIRSSGFTILRQETAGAGDQVLLVGVDDPARGRETAEASLLPKEESRFVILLKHRPTVDEQAEGRFDLQLSGHAHRGQIFPFNYLTGLFYPLQNGLYSLAGGSHLYTSRGTGTWGPPMRILSPPEITLIEISGVR